MRALYKRSRGFTLKPLLYGLVMLAFAACSQNDGTTTTTTETTATAASDTTATQPATETTASAAPAAGEEKSMSDYENKVVELHTTAGEIHLRFFPDVAPGHVKNFIDLAQSGFYDGTKFHRVIAGFMIQGGDPNTKAGNPSTWGIGGSGRNVKAEFNTVSHKRGILSMARSQMPDSASSQFFIVVADSPFLDRNYTVFGQVTKGMDVADKIVDSAKGSERPAEPVTITKAVVRDATDTEKGPTPK